MTWEQWLCNITLNCVSFSPLCDRLENNNATHLRTAIVFLKHGTNYWTVTRACTQCCTLQCCTNTFAPGLTPFLASTFDKFIAWIGCLWKSCPDRCPAGAIMLPSKLSWVRWKGSDECSLPGVSLNSCSLDLEHECILVWKDVFQSPVFFGAALS